MGARKKDGEPEWSVLDVVMDHGDKKVRPYCCCCYMTGDKKVF